MNRQPMIQQTFLRSLVYASTVILLVGGIVAIRYFLGDHPYFYAIIGGFVVLSMVFLGMKLFLLKTLSRGPNTTSGKSTEENE